jgi:GTPase SAR1 family protein
LYPNHPFEVFVICINTYHSKTFHNLLQHWTPEINFYFKSAKFLVVGTKCDLRDDKELLERLKNRNKYIVSSETAKIEARSVDSPFIETSSLYNENIDIVFEEIVKTHLKPSKKQKKKCILN